MNSPSHATPSPLRRPNAAGRLAAASSLGLALLLLASCGRSDESARRATPGYQDPAAIMAEARFTDLEGNEVNRNGLHIQLSVFHNYRG